MTSASYRSAFENWDSRASVRVKPLRPTTDETATFFPPEQITGHEELRGVLTPEAWRRYLVLNMQAYLDFTVQLEALIVLPVTALIGVDRSGVELPEAMRRDAMAITTDEAWHGQFTADLMRRIHAQTSVAPSLPATYEFQRTRDRLRDSVAPALRPAFDLLVTYVSETLISTRLMSMPRDGRLPGYVREVVADHCEDERRHHAYFRAFLPYLWRSLAASERSTLAALVPDTVVAFLGRDKALEEHLLVRAGMDAAAARDFTHDFTDRSVGPRIARDSLACVRYLAELHAVDLDRFQERLAAA
ncbi:diiron oxygenase [Micromonospora sp. CPCC 205546]|uniref:diiron oxygenase n=1 Tax=Micromonospora sp. CPCC 205546 TaxID=3122397 RepID=UPI002FEEBB7A